jgi:hypothetical protein
MEPVSRNGLSLVRNGCSLSEASIPESTFLACHFKTRQLDARPVRPLLACLHWFAPVEGSFIAQARCGSTRRLAQLLPLPPLPSRTFTSLGIKAFNRFRRLAARLPTTPDFLSLPAARSFQIGYGSPFQDRYVSGGLLFLKPLGTFFTMPATSFPVNEFMALETAFPQHLSGLFLNDYTEAPVQCLWIKQPSEVVLLCRIAPAAIEFEGAVTRENRQV